MAWRVIAVVLCLQAVCVRCARVGAGQHQLRAAAQPDGSPRVALVSPYGKIVLRLLTDNAPASAALVLQQAKDGTCADCNFYRAEARPDRSKGDPAEGPPYALLQGQLSCSRKPPTEGRLPVTAGSVAFIPDTTDFFISLGDHSEWGTAHTVFAEVESFTYVDLIAVQRTHTVTHEEFGTKMRMMNDPVAFGIALE